MKKIQGLICAAVFSSFAASAQADVIDDWTEQWLDTIRAVGGPPCPIARNGAVVWASVYEAVNSINHTHQPYINFVPVARPASRNAAAVAAAHTALVALFPDRQAIYDAQFNTNLAALGSGPEVVHGVAVGEAAANQILAARADDRTDLNPTYTYLNIPGSYQPTAPDFHTPPFNPGWGTTEPWCMTSGSQFRPSGPLGFFRLDRLLASRGYANALNQVKVLGKRVSPTRTAEQTEIAWFWANDRDGTFKPPGQLLYITQVVANDQHLPLDSKARLFALVSIAMGDAGLVSWDMKYSTNTDLWRPITAIRMADTDNNPLTTKDETWEPLNDFTPPFPTYTSGHGTFGAAHAAIMKDFFDRDDITFTIGTDEPIVSSVTRTFHSFSEAAREDGLSRIYLGLHFRFDADIAYATGTLLGDYTFNHILGPISTCAGDMNGDGVMNNRDLNAFTTAYFANDLRADMDGNQIINSTDYYAFVGAFLHGCDAH